jgi:hypothetical protein
MPKVPLIESHAWLANSYANAAARVSVWKIYFSLKRDRETQSRISR